MKNRHIFILWGILLSIVCNAQIVTDGTVGSATQLQGPDFQIGSELGAISGNNLFHSFETFNLNSGESATFSGPASIARIISRVTGGNPSNIDGTIRSTISGADFYFLNPAGIIFGPNASLDLSGSFHASTANYLCFEDGAKFYAQPLTSETLSTSAPSSFGFLDQPTGKITINGSILKTAERKDFSLTASEIEMKGGEGTNEALIEALGGMVNLHTLAEEGEIDFSNMRESDFSGSIHIEDTRIVTGAPLGTSGGGIRMSADTITTSEGDHPLSSELHSASNGTDRSEGIVIRGNEMNLDDLSIKSDTYGQNDGGDIDIVAERLTLSGCNISAGTSFRGNMFQANAGNITLDVSGTLTVNGGLIRSVSLVPPPMQFPTLRAAPGTISLNASDIFLNNAQIATEKIGRGMGTSGRISVIAENRLSLNSTQITSSAVSTNMAAGELFLKAGDIIVTDSSHLGTSSFGGGNAGVISVEANNFSLLGESTIHSVSGFQAGDAGIVILDVTGDLTLSGAGVEIGTSTASAGKGGDIELYASNFKLSDGASVSASSTALTNAGDAGNILIEAGQADFVNGVRVETESLASGGGKITINSDSYLNFNGATVTTQVKTGEGDAGNICVQGQNAIVGDSKIIANADEGNGGNITIVADNIIKSQASVIEASSRLGVDGNIDIRAPESEINENAMVLEIEYVDNNDWVYEQHLAQIGESSSFLCLYRQGRSFTVGEMLSWLPGTEPKSKKAKGNLKRPGKFFDYNKKLTLPLRLRQK